MDGAGNREGAARRSKGRESGNTCEGGTGRMSEFGERLEQDRAAGG